MRRRSILVGVVLLIVNISSAQPAGSPFETSVAPIASCRIDELVLGQLQQLRIPPANLCSDAVFVRRVYLDVIGLLPTASEAGDFILKVLDASGQQLAINDDLEDKATDLNTHHADSYVRVRFPADGKCFIYLGNTQRQGGSEFGYRLRLSAPRPDFELRAVPASLSVRSGGIVTFRVVALRKDGCTNDIIVALRDAPAGFKLSGGRITASTNETKLTLTAPFTAASEPYALSLIGRASVAGVEIVRPVVSAEDQMQAFFYRHLVPAQEFQVKVVRRPGAAQRDRPR